MDEIHEELTALRVSAARAFEVTEARLEDSQVNLHDVSFASGYYWGWTQSLERQQTIQHAQRYEEIADLDREYKKVGCLGLVLCVSTVANAASIIYNLFF